jgi:dTDP-4-dehydrorhamnose reductase
MKVLILGSTGMLGHKLHQVLTKTFEVAGTVRSKCDSLDRYGFFHKSDVLPDIDAGKIPTVEKAIDKTKPNVVINCIGIIKSRKEAQDRLPSIQINTLFPHQLYKICRKRDIRLIHISTDCVFSGKIGNYQETDIADAEDIYGKTKYLGEIAEEGTLTIRTSIIGRELSTTNNLVEWFISNGGKQVQGYTNAIFNGFPTMCFAQIIAKVIADTPKLSGLYHISSEPISKYKLLTLIRDKMSIDIDIEEYPHYYCNRSLDSSLYRSKSGFKPHSWEDMIDEFVIDAQQYRQWRTK